MTVVITQGCGESSTDRVGPVSERRSVETIPQPELVTVDGRGDPNCLAVSDDESVLFLGEGTTIAVRDLRGDPFEDSALLARIELDATILDLEPVGNRLFVAGGSFGLLEVDWRAAAEGHAEVHKVIRHVTAACADVEVAGDRLLVLFSAKEKSELAIFDLETTEVITRRLLSRGIGYSVKSRGDFAWLAMGTAGIARIELDEKFPGKLEWGPAGAALGPKFCLPEHTRVRDLALGDEHVYMAADSSGLARVSLDADWSESMQVENWPLKFGGKVTYASVVDVDAGRIAVGTNMGPVEVLNGAPYHSLGWMDHRFAIGGVDFSSFTRGEGEELVLMREEETGLRFEGRRTLQKSAWRSLVIRDECLYEQHSGLGTILSRVENGSISEIDAARSGGFSAIDGTTSLIDPGRILFGTDPAGSSSAYTLSLNASDELVDSVSSDRNARIGLLVGASCVDEFGAEWFLTDMGFYWGLYRNAPNASALDRWKVLPPLDADGIRGTTYLNSSSLADLLVLSRSRSKYGVVLASFSDLLAKARNSPLDTEIEIDPRVQVQTHPQGDPMFRMALRTTIRENAAGRIMVAVAGGSNVLADQESAESAKLILIDATEWGSGEAQVVGEALGSNPEGASISIAMGRINSRDYCFVADFAHGVHVFDVTEPKQPKLVGDWQSPVSTYDGRQENVLDLELEFNHSRDQAVLWVAAGRAGLVSLDVSQPEVFGLPVLSIDDTPGWAAGVHLSEVHGQRRLFVGDQKAGLRVYR